MSVQTKRAPMQQTYSRDTSLQSVSGRSRRPKHAPAQHLGLGPIRHHEYSVAERKELSRQCVSAALRES